jgi:hypothetical protein
MLFLFGWLGPLGLSVAWYANIPLLLCASKMFRGKPPKISLSLGGAFVAYTALLPHFVPDMSRGGWQPEDLFGPALWIWLPHSPFWHLSPFLIGEMTYRQKRPLVWDKVRNQSKGE